MILPDGISVIELVNELEDEYGSITKVPENNSKLKLIRNVSDDRERYEIDRSRRSRKIKGIKKRIRQKMTVSQIARAMRLDKKEVRRIIIKFGLLETKIVVEDTKLKNYMHFDNVNQLVLAMMKLGVHVTNTTVNYYLDTKRLVYDRYKLYTVVPDIY